MTVSSIASSRFYSISYVTHGDFAKMTHARNPKSVKVMIFRNLLRTRTLLLALWATMYEILDHGWVDKSTLSCQNPRYEVTLEHYVEGRLVGVLKVKTCTACDPGA